MLGHAPLLAFFVLADIALPFLWLCSAVAWGIRTVRHTGDNLYSGMLDGRGHAVIAIIALTVLTSTLAMCLRQLRHLGEVPGDFGWMPFYILFSTLVLMPIRIYGFLRCGHVGGWGTRADAFAGGPDEPAAVPLPDEISEKAFDREVSALIAVSQNAADRQPGVQVAATAAMLGAVRVQTMMRPATKASTNESTDGDPRGLIPYLIGSAVLIVGVLYDVLPV
jgi:hyaluronan synthase